MRFSTLGITFPIVSLLFLLTSTIQRCSASVTVYYQIGQTPLATAPATASSANYTGPVAYSPVVLDAPAPPGASAFPTSFAIQMSGSVPIGASIRQNGSFFGFSIEMSVVNQVCEWHVWQFRLAWLIFWNFSGEKCVCRVFKIFYGHLSKFVVFRVFFGIGLSSRSLSWTWWQICNNELVESTSESEETLKKPPRLWTAQPMAVY